MPHSKDERVVHPEFAVRMQQACDGNPNVPPQNYGRLGWFVKEMGDRFGIRVTNETIRKWFNGETIPRPKSMKALASILSVDEAWLSVGKVPEVPAKTARIRNAAADGSVNVVAGFIQMCGGHPAFPLDNDERAKKEKVDLYAVIRGAQYAFHVTLGDLRDDGVHFAVPVEAASPGVFVIGVVRVSALHCEFYELPPEALEEEGRRRSGFIEVVMTPDSVAWKKIKTFAERL